MRWRHHRRSSRRPRFSAGLRLYAGMMTSSEHIAQRRTMNLPDAVASLRPAGVSLHTPNGEETARPLSGEKKQSPAVKEAANRLDGQPAPSSGWHPDQDADGPVAEVWTSGPYPARIAATVDPGVSTVTSSSTGRGSRPVYPPGDQTRS